MSVVDDDTRGATANVVNKNIKKEELEDDVDDDDSEWVGWSWGGREKKGKGKYETMSKDKTSQVGKTRRQQATSQPTKSERETRIGIKKKGE